MQHTYHGLKKWLHSLPDKPTQVFLILSSCVGFIFIFLFPPFMVIDEPTHFWRAYQISEGHIIGEAQAGTSGGVLPKQVASIVQHYTPMIYHYEIKADISVIKADLKEPLRSNDKTFVGFQNSVIYPPFTYLPQAVGMKIATLLGGSALSAMYCARVLSLLTWIAAGYYAIRLIPFGKWPLTIIGLFPMILSQAASVSSDATINSCCFLFIALILYARHNQTIMSRTFLLGLTALSLVFALIKPPYFLLLGLLFMIPAKQFPKRISRKYWLACTLLLVASLLFLWGFLSAKLRYDLPDYNASVALQLSYIIHHPLNYIKTLILYPLTVRMDATTDNLFGMLGWNEVRIPHWIIYSGYCLLLLSLTDPALRKIKDAGMRYASFATGALMALATTTLVYLSWVTVGYPYIFGLWGRYFASSLALSIPALGGILSLQISSWNKIRRALPLLLALILLIVMFLVWNRYYHTFQLGYKFVNWADK